MLVLIMSVLSVHPIRAVVTIGALLVSGSAYASCSAPFSRADLQGAIVRIEQAWISVDDEAFVSTGTTLDQGLPCLTDRLSPQEVAALHRIQGLRSYYAGEREERPQRAFYSARVIEPAYQFPAELVAATHPVMRLYAAPLGQSPPPILLPPPASGTILIDGSVSMERPVDRPVFVQLLNGDGAVTESAYLWYDMPMPDYPLPAPVVEVIPPPTPDRSALATGLWAGAAGGAVVSAALYAIALGTLNTYEDPATPYSELDTLRGRTNTLVGVSTVTVALAVGSGVGAMWVVKW